MTQNEAMMAAGYRFAYQLNGRRHADFPRCQTCRRFVGQQGDDGHPAAKPSFCDLHLSETTPRAGCRMHESRPDGGGRHD